MACKNVKMNVVSMPSRRLGRPPKTSREQILDAAALIDPLDLQITGLAAQLGVSVRTVYHYFPNRKALLDALTERALQELHPPDLRSATDWREVLRLAANWVFVLVQDHPDCLSVTGPPGAGLRVLDDVIGRLVEQGFETRDAMKSYSAISAFAFGAAASANRTRAAGGLAPHNVRRQLGDHAPPELVGRIAPLMFVESVDAWFEQCLEVILDGIATSLAPQPG